MRFFFQMWQSHWVLEKSIASRDPGSFLPLMQSETTKSKEIPRKQRIAPRFDPVRFEPSHNTSSGVLNEKTLRTEKYRRALIPPSGQEQLWKDVRLLGHRRLQFATVPSSLQFATMPSSLQSTSRIACKSSRHGELSAKRLRKQQLCLDIGPHVITKLMYFQ